MERRRPAAPAAFILLALAVTLIAAACGTSTGSTGEPTASFAPPASGGTTPTPSGAGPSAVPIPTPEPAAVYAEIEAQVQELRSLAAKRAVDPKLLDEATLKKNVAADFAKDNPPELVMAKGRLLELMGLLPAGSSLMDLYIELLGSQVAGYYDPHAKELYVVSKSGGLGPTERVSFAHEFTHALQDQHFDLTSLHIDAIGQGDASLAHLSLAEGDATLLMSLWAQAHLTPPELIQLAVESNDPEQARILAEMPEILKQALLFPYSAGLQLVLARQAAGGWAAVDAMYAKLPASTEQVLHPEKYAAAETPIEVAFPADLATRLGTGWTVDLQDTLGEFQLRIWLESAGHLNGDAAITAASGWGGDRVALVRNGDRFGAVLDTRWDSAKDAAEFAAAAQTTLDKLTARHAMIAIDGTTRVTLFFASDDATISALASVLGLAG
jgi:hypothetical protein